MHDHFDVSYIKKYRSVFNVKIVSGLSAWVCSHFYFDLYIENGSVFFWCTISRNDRALILESLTTPFCWIRPANILFELKSCKISKVQRTFFLKMLQWLSVAKSTPPKVRNMILLCEEKSYTNFMRVDIFLSNKKLSRTTYTRICVQLKSCEVQLSLQEDHKQRDIPRI